MHAQSSSTADLCCCRLVSFDPQADGQARPASNSELCSRFTILAHLTLQCGEEKLSTEHSFSSLDSSEFSLKSASGNSGSSRLAIRRRAYAGTHFPPGANQHTQRPLIQKPPQNRNQHLVNVQNPVPLCSEATLFK